MIAVIGAGTMGRGIAEVAACSGFDVTLFDADAAALARAQTAIEEALSKAVDKNRLTAAAKGEALARLSFASSLEEALKGAQLVIEAVPEQLALKRDLLLRISQLAPKDALLASNTSSLSITEIALQTSSIAERFLGLHFFNPPSANKLLEIVRGQQTSEASVARAKAYGEQLGRDVIVVNDSPGFASSRLGVVLALEAMRMVEQGVASAADIDRAMESGYRHAMGPLRTTDLVGLDVRLAIAEALHAKLGSAQYQPPALLRQMVAAGKLGKKSGQGFYPW